MSRRNPLFAHTLSDSLQENEMHKHPLKIVGLAAAFAAAFAMIPADALAAKKKRKHRHHRPVYSERYNPSPGEYNECKRNQIRFPTLDIRC
jgi:hypothetical protein